MRSSIVGDSNNNSPSDVAFEQAETTTPSAINNENNNKLYPSL